VRPWHLTGGSGRPLNLTLRSRVGRHVPPLVLFTRAIAGLNRIFGACAIAGGLILLVKCAWHLLQGTRQWSQEYFAVLFGVAMVIAGIVYLRALPSRRERKSGNTG